MKKFIAIGLMTIFAATMMVGCGDKNNSATAPTDSPETTMDGNDNAVSTDTPAATDDTNDVSDDVKNGVNDLVDGAADGVNDVVDGVDNAVNDVTGNR